MMNEMAAYIMTENDESHDVSTSSELALLCGMSFSQVLAAAAGRVVVCVDDAPASSSAATVRPASKLIR